jgi:polar amino acid transport system substrate-binding protein
MLAAGGTLLIIMAGSAGAQADPPTTTTPTASPVAPTPVVARDPTRPGATLRVVTKPLEPFVIRTARGEVGFSIDLWNEIARRNGWTTEWVANETVAQLLQTVRDGKADAGIAGISMTREREDQLDFSHPVYDSGLQVLVSTRSARDTSRLLGAVFTRDLGLFAGGVIAALIVAGHLVWLYQRRHGGVERSYVRGVGQGVWVAAATALACDLLDGAPRRVLGRAVSILWLLVGVMIVAMLTASVTSRLTVDSIDTEIQGMRDLSNKRVATVVETTTSRYLDSIDQRYVGVSSIDEAYTLLHDRSVDAVVFDAPVLAYHALTKGRGREKLVGPMFHRESYGIAMPTDSPLRERVNRSILEIMADGTYERIATQWFGREGG